MSNVGQDGIVVSREGEVVWIRLERPESRNALSNAVLAGLAAQMEAAQRAGARCIVVAGSERVFAAGADIKEFQGKGALEHYFGARYPAWDRIRQIFVPTVAVVRGFCLGGGFELALSCDLIVASETAQFGLPEPQLGLVPGGGASQLLRRTVGRSLTMDLLLTGRRLSATEAKAAGLVMRVAPDESVDAVGREVAESICRRSPVALRLAKETVNRSFELGFEAGIEFERRAFVLSLASPDAAEGIAAFLEKRAPSWRTT